MPRSLSRLIAGKARTYLRASAAVFVLSMLLAGTSLVFLEAQYFQREADFLANDAVHLVRVTGSDSAGLGEYLRFGDAGAIEQAIRRAHPDVSAVVSVEYTLNYGISGKDGDVYFFYGLGGMSEELLGLADMADDTAYGVGSEPREITLQVPVITVESGGIASEATVAVPIAVRGGVPPDNPLAVLEDADPSSLYVNARTFAGLVETSFGITWDEFTEQYDRSNPYGIDAIKGVFVWVEDLGDVRGVADTLKGLGFSTSYTLRAFDDLAGSLRSSGLMWLGIAAAAACASAVYILVSIDNYMRASHKDIAVLLHFGFSSAAVATVYLRSARRLLLLVGGVAVSYASVVGLVLLPGGAFKPLILNAVGLVSVLVAVYVLIAWRIIPSHASRPLLELLRVGREFE